MSVEKKWGVISSVLGPYSESIPISEAREYKSSGTFMSIKSTSTKGRGSKGGGKKGW